MMVDYKDIVKREGRKMKRSQRNKYMSSKKKKGKTSTIVLSIIAILMTGIVSWVAVNDWDVKKSFKKIEVLISGFKEEPVDEVEVEGTPNLSEDPEQAEIPDEPIETEVNLDNGGYLEDQQLPVKPTYIKNVLIANKKYPLPSTFAPGENKEARAAFEKLAADAVLSGFNLKAFSTYRSFEYQTDLYARYVERDGKEEADRYSARPGYSEHQTGLAFDIGELNYEQHWASSSFGDTEAAKWLAQNAHRFGFVMRYPLGKEEITGYIHESWHYRYIGIEIATEIFEQQITIEEYLGI